MDQQTQNSRLVRSTFAVSLPTLLSRVLGYIRDMLQAYYLGTGRSADAFTIAYVIPNLLRRLTGEGAMTAAFIPVFTQLKSESRKEELWKFANTFFFDLTVMMAVLTVVGMIFTPLLVRVIAYGFKGVQGKWDLTIVLTRMMFPYIFLISLSALAMAILNSFKKFFVPALTPVLFNLAIITAAVCGAARAKEPAMVFAVGVVIGGCCQLAFQLPFLWRQGMRFRWGLSFTHPAVRKVGRLMLPGIFGVGISQINFALSRMIASLLEEGSVSSLYYASRIQELTLGIFSIALSIVLLPTLSELAAQKDHDRMKDTLAFSFRLIFFITLPAMAGLLILNMPIIRVLYERGVFDAQSSAMSASCLFFFAFGLPFISGVKILAPAFYSLKDTRTPVVVAFFVMLAYILSSILLMRPLRVGGIALALSLSSVLNFFLLFHLLERKIGPVNKRGFLPSALKSGLSSVLMGGGIWAFMRIWEFQTLSFARRIGVLAAAIVLGLVIYTVGSLLFNHEEVLNFRMMMRAERKTKVSQ